MTDPDVVLVSGDAEVRDLVATAAAALGQRASPFEAETLAQAWQGAGTIFIGVDAAAEVAALRLPRRERVYLVGRDGAAAALWSMPLGAELILLPEGRAWLSSVLARGPHDGAGELLAVLGGSGGVGASTLAAALAWRAAGHGRSVALVDIDRLGGGIDLLLGAEREPGWRWPRFTGADGVLGALAEFLPVVDGVAIVSMARGPDRELAREPLAAVLGSLKRTHDLVLLDSGRGGGAASREALRLASRSLMVVGGSVRGVAAAGQAVQALAPPACEVVLRQWPGAGVPDDVVEDVIGLPVRARLRHDPRLVGAAERGERPSFGRRRAGLGRVCDELLAAA